MTKIYGDLQLQDGAKIITDSGTPLSSEIFTYTGPITVRVVVAPTDTVGVGSALNGACRIEINKSNGTAKLTTTAFRTGNVATGAGGKYLTFGGLPPYIAPTNKSANTPIGTVLAIEGTSNIPSLTSLLWAETGVHPATVVFYTTLPLVGGSTAATITGCVQSIQWGGIPPF